MGAAYLQKKDIEQVIFLIDKGFSTEDTRNLLGRSSSTVTYIYRMVKDLRDGNVEDLKIAMENSRSGNMARLCAECLEIDLDKFLADKPEPPKPDPNALVVLEKLNGMMAELRDALREVSKTQGQILLALQGARQENNAKLDAIKEAVNINGDIASKEHEALRIIVDNIKGNVKALARKGGVEQ